MLDLQPFKTRKRRHSDLTTSTPTDASPKSPKKHKSSHSYQSQLSPRFWDNLSRIDLTKAALRELDRRNAYRHSTLTPVATAGPPLTRHSLANRKRSLSLAGQKNVPDNLNRFARIGGPDLSYLRGYSCPIDIVDPMSQSRSRSRKPKLKSTPSSQNISKITNTTSTKSTEPYNRNFQQNLVDHGVYPDGYEYPDGEAAPEPDNWQEINISLAQPRPSLSPSKCTKDDFRQFKRADKHASKEKQVCTSVIPIIEGDIRDLKCVSGGIPFTNLDHLTDGTLAPGNPDIYHGARPEQLERRIREELNGLIVPSTQDDLPILPNFVLTAKGPDGSLAVAGRQACYDGALGARSMHALQSYGKETVTYDNKAYTITSIYHGGQLKIFTSHPYQRGGSSNSPKYGTTPLRSFAMTDTDDTFRQGATYLRNARDWTKEQRDLATTEANARAEQRRSVRQGPTPSAKSSDESDQRQGTNQELVSSFTTEICTIGPSSEMLSRDVHQSEGSETTVGAIDKTSEELATQRSLEGKRANRLSRELDNPQPKKRKASSASFVR